MVVGLVKEVGRLRYTKKVYSSLVYTARLLQTLQKLDLKTLHAMQLTALGASQADADSLHDRVRSGELFGAFDDR